MIAGPGFERTGGIATRAFVYDGAMQAADGGTGVLAITICQMGDHGASRPSTNTSD